MSDDFIDKEEQNEENIPTPENGHLDYKPADTQKNRGEAPAERNVSELVFGLCLLRNTGTCRTAHQ